MTDQNEIVPLCIIPVHFIVNFDDQRTVASMTCNRRRLASSHRLRDTVRAKNHDGPFRNLVQLFDEDGALVAQRIDDVTAVDNFMADVDRCSVLFQRKIDDIDRPVDPAQKPRGLAR